MSSRLWVVMARSRRETCKSGPCLPVPAGSGPLPRSDDGNPALDPELAVCAVSWHSRQAFGPAVIMQVCRIEDRWSRVQVRRPDTGTAGTPSTLLLGVPPSLSLCSRRARRPPTGAGEGPDVRGCVVWTLAAPSFGRATARIREWLDVRGGHASAERSLAVGPDWAWADSAARRTEDTCRVSRSGTWVTGSADAWKAVIEAALSQGGDAYRTHGQDLQLVFGSYRALASSTQERVTHANRGRVYHAQ